MSPAEQTMEAFFTRHRANEGIELALDLPDGTPTLHRIKIRGMDSDAFAEAQAASKRRLAELLQTGDKKAVLSADHETERLKMIAALVVSWTFQTPITEAAVVDFLRNAPAIAEQIDRVASNRRLFMKKDLKNSGDSQPPNLN